MNQSTLAVNFFKQCRNNGFKDVTVSEIKEMQPFLWCAALVVKARGVFTYVDCWKPCYILTQDINNGIDSRVTIPK